MKDISRLTIFTGAALVLAFLFIGASVVFSNAQNTPTAQAQELDGVEVTFYKSPTCGCCAGHAQALEAAGAYVYMREVDEITLQDIKQEKGIAFDKQSCHTAVIGGYVVEGHVPVEALVQLLAEKPDIKGITLPGMPVGTPGMPGKQTEPYVVETLEGDIYWQKNPS